MKIKPAVHLYHSSQAEPQHTISLAAPTLLAVWVARST